MAAYIKPANFAGRFYPRKEHEILALFRQFELSLDKTPQFPDEVIGIISPHAGYEFSGKTAMAAYQVALSSSPETILVIGLAHRVPLKGVSILDAVGCETPLGRVDLDQEFASQLADALPSSRLSHETHNSEHSIETQYPFIKYLYPNSRVVEILIQDYAPPLPENLGNAITKVSKSLGRKILVVASTDLSHYPSAAIAEEIDHLSLKTLLKLDPGQVRDELARIESEYYPGVSCAVCSKAAVIAGVAAAKSLGADKSKLINYTHSGMSQYGDRNQVVGYGAIAWLKSHPN